MNNGLLTCGLMVAFGGMLAACNDDDNVVAFQNPEEIRSEAGALRTTLTVAEAQVEVAGKSVRTNVYNGTYMPPLLRVRPGDTIFLNLVNQMSEPTNEHYHGMNVSPRINPDATVSDNIFVQADPGTQVNYKIVIPEDHPPGLFWYHSHLHGSSERQVMGGLSGGLIVEGILDPFPELQGIEERVLLLKDIQITPQGELPDDIDPSADTHRTVNGLTNPTIVISPGETQFWRIGNIGSDLYYHLVLDGHVLYELARDGNRHNQLVPMTELLLPPSSRSEVLIQGGPRGRYALRALAFDTGPVGDSYGEAQLATLVSVGVGTEPMPLPSAFPAVEDLRTLPVARKRTITFAEDTTNNTFFIDSGAGPLEFDPNRVDSTIEAGTIEEWTINNASQELHVFHIHQTDFQVTEINGVPQPFVGRQDTVNVPFQADANGPPGQAKVLIDFRNPLTEGKFVYHCHILEHEDGGMMAVAEVVAPPGIGLPPQNAWVQYASAPGSRGSVLERRARELAASQAQVISTLGAVQSGSFCRTDPRRPRIGAILADGARR